LRYRARVIPLFEGHRQEEKATWEYTDAASIAQAGRFMRLRFPYPKFVVEEPVADPRVPENIGLNIAKELNIRYDGVQKELGMQFTDIRTGTTFYANSLAEAKNRLSEKRNVFAVKRRVLPDGSVGK